MRRLKNCRLGEKSVITLYYYEDLMLREISQMLDISESRVSQIHHQGLFMLSF
ncbi:sigma factor-like helix-turn-helix DNA-binding protein [Candidatus Kuenenia stuttgartensis]|uniref:sigma factor-like helix-turn-helix DNA-binding protein n=1 Tax=Kuenenia stuttgartiensis TaxID=174633 RepID=UPI00146E8266